MGTDLSCPEILEKQGLETRQGVKSEGNTGVQKTQALPSDRGDSKAEIRGTIFTASCETGIFPALKPRTGSSFSFVSHVPPWVKGQPHEKSSPFPGEGRARSHWHFRRRSQW